MKQLEFNPGGIMGPPVVRGLILMPVIILPDSLALGSTALESPKD